MMVVLAALTACGGPEGAGNTGSEADVDASGSVPPLSTEAGAAAESAFRSGFEPLAGNHRDAHEAMFVRNFPEVSGIDAPWLSTFVFSGAAQERAAIRQSELDLAPDVRDSAQALLLVSAWEVVNLTEADSADADAVLRQLQAARAAPDTPDQLAVYTLTTAVILEAATRAAQSGDAARAALGDQVRADFIATAGVDLAGLQIGKAGFIRATDASRTPVDD